MWRRAESASQETGRSIPGLVVLSALLLALIVATAVLVPSSPEADELSASAASTKPLPTSGEFEVEKLAEVHYVDEEGTEYVGPAWCDRMTGVYLLYRPNPEKRGETLVALMSSGGVLRCDWQSVAGTLSRVELRNPYEFGLEADFMAQGVAWTLVAYLSNAYLEPKITANPSDPAGEVPHTHL